MSDAAAVAPAAVADATLLHVPLSTLRPSPLNPRGPVDPDAPEIAELAASIAAQGLIEPLLVRPPANGRVEVIAGHRRLAALHLLAERKAIAADHPVAVQLRAATDVEVLELATAENVARQDLSPLAEGRAFKALLAAGRNKKQIAALVGRTERHVEYRLALVERLVPEGRKALESGTLTPTLARRIAAAPTKRQAAIVKEVVRRGAAEFSEDEIASMVREVTIPVAWALFDRAAYTGAVVRLDDGGEAFDDPVEFARLQSAAIAARAAALKKDGAAWVKLQENVYKPENLAYPFAKPGKDETRPLGAVIQVGRGGGPVHVFAPAVDTHARVAAPSRAGRTGAGKAAAPAERSDPWSFWRHVREIKTRALRAAAGRAAGRGPHLPLLRLAHAALAGNRGDLPLEWDSLEVARIWRASAGKTEGQVVGLIAASMAGAIEAIPEEPGKSAGDHWLVVDLARDLGASCAAVWRWDDAKDRAGLLALCSAEQLAALARLLGVEFLPKERGDAKALRALLAKAKAPPNFLPPWLHFGSAEALAERVKLGPQLQAVSAAAAKKPAPKKPAAKAKEGRR